MLICLQCLRTCRIARARLKAGAGTPRFWEPTIRRFFAHWLSWKFVHGDYPPPRSELAAKAALALWSVSGGEEPQGWGAKRERAWRPYFEKAQNPVQVSKRVECLRILHAAKSRADSLGI
jgi:hypothetical protein